MAEALAYVFVKEDTSLRTLALALALVSFSSITACCPGCETALSDCFVTAEEDMLSDFGEWFDKIW